MGIRSDRAITAKGTGKVDIRLSRESITSWDAQYKTSTVLVEDGQTYEIAFEDFVSDELSAPFNPKDVKTLEAVRAFNPYDLYSKSDEPSDVEALRPYYESLIAKFFPPVINW